MTKLSDATVLEQLNIMKLAFQQIKDWVVITDVHGTILYVNSEVEKLSGYSKEEMIGRKPSMWKSELVAEETYKRLWETITSDQVYVGVITNRHKNGKVFDLVNTISPIKDDQGAIRYFVSTARGITRDSMFEEQMHHALHHDILTGLLSRKSFLDTVYTYIQQQNKFALLVITVNKLSLINNTYGFVWGDKVIKEVGNRVKETIGKEFVVSRLEGNMIGILLPGFENPSKIVHFIQTIQQAIKAPMSVENEQIYLSVAFGVSMYPYDMITEEDAETLLTRAQLALFQAKSSNALKNYEFYTYLMNQQANEQLYMESEIYQAFENDEFIPYFQPVINLDTGEACSLEALMRRKKPTGEIISPGQFVGFLEETGLIVEVGMSLIEKICVQMRKWIDHDGLSISVAINLSPVQFKDPQFFEKMMAIVQQQGIPPKLLTFEITESTLVDDTTRTKSLLNKLKTEGFTISIDDFGTGYSSLSYLQEFDVDSLKIDMSFVRDMESNEADRAIVRAIIMMSEGLKLETIAEGVESKGQLDLLKSLGCDKGQGYYWDAPLPAEEIGIKYLR